MTVTAVQRDIDALSLIFTVDLDATPARAWELWADPRQLERWWGPPEYPATFVDHDLTPGGRCSYFMTGPDGEQPRGWWRILTADAPASLEFESGFSTEDGSPDTGMPVMTVRATLDGRPGGGTRLVLVVQYASRAEMERILEMGMEEGMSSAIGQIDGILART